MSDVVERLAELTPEQKEELLAQLLREQASKQPAPRRFPLSFAQRRLWFIDQVEDGSSSLYNLPTPLRLRGKLNIKALERFINELIRRHESLRTTFELNPQTGKPEQVVHPWQPLTLQLTDISDLPEQQREQKLKQLLNDDAQASFDLAKGPLLRVSLVKLSPHEHVLMMTMHHIINDGWSMGVLIKELATLYTAYSTGQESPLAELPIQYSDFAVWQREKWDNGGFLQQMEYWRGQLSGELPVLQLPWRTIRPNRVGTKGAAKRWQINRELSRRVRELNRQEAVTLFMTLLTAFKVLLYRYSGQEDIVVGTPIANRNYKEIEGLIGFFVNTLVLRTDLGGDPTFRELLRRVRDVSFGAYENQDVPFEKVVEELQPDRELGRNPLFQVMFVLQNAPVPEIEMPDLTMSRVTLDTATAKFDLTFAAIEQSEGALEGSIGYSTDLFDESTIDRMIGHYRTLLEGAIANPDERISRLPLLTETERHQMLFEWNITANPATLGKCAHEVFEAQVKRTPEAPALVYDGQQLTYRELNRRANRLAHYLRSLGVGPEVLVGICMEPSIEMIVGVFATLKAGGAYVPLDPRYPKERLNLMLEQVNASVLLIQQKVIDNLPAVSARIIHLDGDFVESLPANEQNPISGALPSNPAYVIYTSGSTGKPKASVLPHEGLCNVIVTGTNAFDIGENDRLSQLAAFSFDVSVWEIFSALLSGAALCLFNRSIAFSDEELIQFLRQQNISTAFFMSAVLMRLPAVDLPALRTIVNGGEGFSRNLVNRWAPGRRYFYAYGPTEATMLQSYHQCRETDLADPPTIGRPMANMQYYVLDKHLQSVPVGVTGELYIGGIGLGRGYSNQPALTAEKFIPHPFSNEPGARLYKSGDLASYRSDGNIDFLGRADQQVKIRGFRIELGEIESVLVQHPAVRETVVVIREVQPGDKRLVAYLVPDQANIPTVSELRRFLKQQLPDFMVPSAFIMLDALPLTSNHKIDRSALPMPDTSRPELEQVYVAPRTEIEQALANIFAEVLGIEKVGLHDNFFELGGHSLLATQVLSRIRERFKVDMSLAPLFDRPTVAELAEEVEQSRSSKEQTVDQITRISYSSEQV